MLTNSHLVGWAMEQVESGRTLTVASLEYPQAWLRCLGVAAPPALWRRGRLPYNNFVGIVGSRNPADRELAFTKVAALQTLASGNALVSGGAQGVDKLACGLHGENINDMRGDTHKCLCTARTIVNSRHV